MSRTFTPPRLTVARVLVLLLVLGLLGGLAAFAATSLAPRSYSAQRQVLVRVWNVDSLVLSGQTVDVTTSDLSDAATIMTSDDVIDRAAGVLGVKVATLLDVVVAEPAQTSAFVRLSVTGPSADEADRRASAVADAFRTVVQLKVLDSARQIIRGLESDTGNARSDIRVRAEAVEAVDPVQIYRTERTGRAGIAPKTATAAGVVAGLGSAALLVVLLAFGAPRLRRPTDVASSLAVPAARWRGATAPNRGGLTGQLREAARGGQVVVCPATPEDVRRAESFAAWLGSTEDDADRGAPSSVGVQLLKPPQEMLHATRPPASDVVSVIVVARTGERTETVGRVVDMLGEWRAVDAVVLVD